MRRNGPGSGVIALTVVPCAAARGWLEVSHPGRRDRVICKVTTPDKAAAIAAEEWAIEMDGYTVITKQEATK